MLEKCIDSALSGTLQPNIFVIDNGGKIEHSKATVFIQQHNLGVSASWNWFLKNISDPILIVNDDIEFSSNDIESFYNSWNDNKEEFLYCNNIPLLNMFSCFLLPKYVVSKVGYFDETFYPAYFEDNDMSYRMKLAGINTKSIVTNISHIGSATIKSYDNDNIRRHHNQFTANKNYYISKWGGLPHEEVYLTPFNK